MQINKPLQSLPDPLREPIAKYIERLCAICGKELLAVTFYGTLRAPLPGESMSLANTAVFREVDLEMLAEIARHGHRFGRSGIAAPWALTPELIDDSRDTFPLELLEIGEEHVAVFGPDYFHDLVFEPAHVRLQCERELKVLEIHLQRGLLAAAGNQRALGRLGLHLSLTLVRVLRGLAWLGDVAAPGSKEADGGHGRMNEERHERTDEEGHPHPALSLEGEGLGASAGLKGSGRGPEERQTRTAFGLVEVIGKSLGHELIGIRRVFDDSEANDWTKFSQLYADVRTLREIADRPS